jgi:hypothetical protein
LKSVKIYAAQAKYFTLNSKNLTRLSKCRQIHRTASKKLELKIQYQKSKISMYRAASPLLPNKIRCAIKVVVTVRLRTQLLKVWACQSLEEPRATVQSDCSANLLKGLERDRYSLQFYSQQRQSRSRARLKFRLQPRYGCNFHGRARCSTSQISNSSS